jgi:hypothetical protein
MMETGGSEASAIRMLEMASEPPFLEMKMTEYNVVFSVEDDYSLTGRICKFENMSPRNRVNSRIMGAGYGAGRFEITWQFKTEKPACSLFNRLRRFRKNDACVYMIVSDESGTEFIY